MHALSQAYIAFATRHAVLLELMFAGKRRAGADRVRETADRAFARALEVIAEAQAGGELPAGDPGRVAIVAFATLQGLAAMANGGMIEAAPVGAVVTDAIDQLLERARSPGRGLVVLQKAAVQLLPRAARGQPRVPPAPQ